MLSFNTHELGQNCNEKKSNENVEQIQWIKGVRSIFVFLLIIINKLMEEILQRLQKCQNWKQMLRSACRLNGLNTSLAGDLTILKLKNLEERFKKSFVTLGAKICSSWIENQLRAFNWLLIALSALQKIKIDDFKQQQWATLKRIFYTKDVNFLKFESRKFLEDKNKKNKNWTQQQEQLLRRQVQKVESQKICWNEVAHKIFQRSNEKFYRSGKHCREHWFNYLDPSKQRGAWSNLQDIYLFDMVASNGKKWSEYAIALKRTEHTVKNRYNSLVIKQKKLTPQIKNEQRLLREIRQRLHQINEQSKGQLKKVISIQQSSPQEQRVQESQQKDSQIKQQVIEFKQVKPQFRQEGQVKLQVKQQKVNKQQVQNIAVQNPLSNYSPALVSQCDLNFYYKQDNEMKRTIFSQYPIYSPYSPYIISPNTPSNYLSPQPVFINQFYSYLNAFMNMTDIVKDPPKKQN